ncbi:MAG: LptF/LptG family permease [candidate division WOR-3 bacterium]
MIYQRFVIKEFIKFLVLAIACVVTIYLLIDLFEELSYFINRKTPFETVLLYYFYSIPFAISLLFPVSVILSCFMVFGSFTRERALHVFQSAGVNIYQLFKPLIIVGFVLIVLQFLFIELITIPANQKLESLKRNKIERQQLSNVKRNNLFLRGREQIIYFIKEYELIRKEPTTHTGIMRNFIIAQYNQAGTLKQRIDGKEAKFLDNRWLAYDVTVRYFVSDTTMVFQDLDTMTLAITEKPDFFMQEVRNIEQLHTWELATYIKELKIAGVKTIKAEVELHYRIANNFIALILILMSLPLAISLKRGGVMFGLGLGLLFAFIYWGLIQITKALGQVLLLSPVLAAWFANLLFLAVAIYLLIDVRKYA